MYLLRHVPWHNFIHEDRGGTPVLSFFGWYSAQTNRKLTKKKHRKKVTGGRGDVKCKTKEYTSKGYSAVFAWTQRTLSK